KKRISGEGGHISNAEAAGLLASAFRKRLKWASLAHLSEQNNSPMRALETHRDILGDNVEICVAGRYGISDLLTL
ncbi:MAG TPA: hypothetical protein VLA34_05500, partial [Candidatus Krumholzibacterium sp.]|nr:hypothetical protein [Candidatus Krumholzibacterium sp.]